MPSVAYYVIPHKIINGTLFYAMEYFLVCNEITPTQLLLKCDEKTYNYILDIFSVKYNYDTSLNKNIKFFNKYTDLPKLVDDRVLMLDNNTFRKIHSLIKYKKFLYSENDENNLHIQNTEIYGYYSYQNFNIKTRLKLANKYFKHYPATKETFYSSMNTLTSKSENKKMSNTFLNIVEFKKWVYTQTRGIGLDSGNRFIPEAYFYGKELEVKLLEDVVDSIKDRYELFLNNNIDVLSLDKTDILVNDFMNDYSSKLK